jgi:hypothetical protein
MDIGGNFTLGGLRLPKDLSGPSFGAPVSGLDQIQGFLSRLLPKNEGQIPLSPQPRFGEKLPQPQGSPLNEFLGGGPVVCTTPNFKPTPPDGSNGGPVVCTTPNFQPKQG